MRIDPADLAESIGTLADLDPDRGLTRGLDRVVAAATTLFAADTAGLMLLAKDGTLTAASAFDQQGELAELAQAQLGQGPCMDAFTRGVPVAIPDLRADPRFDQIAFVLRSAGIRGALCVPVRSWVARSAPWICSPPSPEPGMTARSRRPMPTPGWWPACSGRRWPPMPAAGWPDSSRSRSTRGC
jgi:GAF domain